MSVLAHMQIALGELGQREISGADNNSRIVDYFDSVSYRATDDETPWCAAFVNWVLMTSEVARTKSAAALSFMDWGIKTTKPKYGDIVVFDHGRGRGHVGFFVSSDGKTVSVLGGNQNDEVNVTKFPVNSVAAYRTMKTAIQSKTVVASAAIAATTVGAAITPMMDAAITQHPDITSYGNALLPFLPVEWQGIGGALITLTGAVVVYVERIRKLKSVQS